MTREEINKVFDFLENEMNKGKYFEFLLTDANSVTAFWKSDGKTFAQFYITPILKLKNKNEN